MSAADAWNPGQYGKFERERSQPFFDLLALVQPKPGMRVADLGCGTGELTRVLHERLGARETIGIDSSDAMLAKCTASAGGGLSCVRGDIATFADATPFDLVFSNAAIHWVPDHEALLGRLAGMLAPGGQLAVQVPANHDHASHVVAARVAGESPFREALGGYVRTKPILEPEEYATLLHRLGFAEQHVRLQVYAHLLDSREDVVEWVKGTLLTDYQKRMGPEMFAAFLAAYRDRLMPELDGSRPYFYAFKRVLFQARREG